MHRVVKQALGQALKSEMPSRNPADAVEPPKVDWKPMQGLRRSADRGTDRGRSGYTGGGPCSARRLVWSTPTRNLRSAPAERRSSDRPNLGGRKS
jgi:hypothetical protein